MKCDNDNCKNPKLFVYALCGVCMQMSEFPFSGHICMTIGCYRSITIFKMICTECAMENYDFGNDIL
jgi:hypothetical protein